MSRSGTDASQVLASCAGATSAFVLDKPFSEAVLLFGRLSRELIGQLVGAAAPGLRREPRPKCILNAAQPDKRVVRAHRGHQLPCGF